MKNLILLLAMAISSCSFGQKYVVTPSGLRNSSDNEKTFIVIEVSDLSAKKLYDNAIKFINESYKNPKEVIKGQTDGEYLKFDSYVPELLSYNNSGAKIPIQATYTTEMRFKDRKVRYEIVSLDMTNKTGNFHVLFTGGLFEGYIIYNKNGKLFKAETKRDIENYFNYTIDKISKYLKGENQIDDW